MDDQLATRKGTGTTALTDLLGKEISDKDFNERKKLVLKKDDVLISSKELLLYYNMFGEHFDKPSAVNKKKSGGNALTAKTNKNEIRFLQSLRNFSHLSPFF